MSTPVQRIKQLLSCVPEKDIPHANKFIKERDFEALRDLVKSDIQILLRKKDEFLEEQIDNLRLLKTEIDSYLLLLGLEDDEEVETDFWEGE